jgi:hypothetical protein
MKASAWDRTGGTPVPPNITFLTATWYESPWHPGSHAWEPGGAASIRASLAGFACLAKPADRAPSPFPRGVEPPLAASYERVATFLAARFP